MNKVILMGRLTKDPEVRQAGETAVARYTIAVDRRQRSNNTEDATADFISIVAFGKGGEFADKYLKKGTKILVTGRIQTGSYTNREGNKVYTTDVIAEEQEFAESKKEGECKPEFKAQEKAKQDADPTQGFMNFPENYEDDLPFGQPTR